MSPKKLSIVDIAKMAGVSTATVSRVINKSGGYSAETEKKILEIIEKSNYTPNVNAIGLRTNKSKSVGIVVPDITNEFFAKIVRVIDTFFLAHKYSVFICDSNEDEQIEDMHINNLIEKNVDGIIYISGRTDVMEIDDKYSMPVVYIDRKPNHADVLIESDNVHGGYLAGKELIEKGCRRIVFLRDSRNVSPVRHRYRGFVQAVNEMIGKVNEPIKSFEVCVNPDYDSSKNKVAEILENELYFDGVFATNDLMALGCIHALVEKGYKVPEDVKVVGFDDVSIAKFCNPPITTITQNTDELGRLAAEALYRLMSKKDIKQKVMIVPVSLNVRGST